MYAVAAMEARASARGEPGHGPGLTPVFVGAPLSGSGHRLSRTIVGEEATLRCAERIFPRRHFAGTIPPVSEDGTDRREALRLFVLGGMAAAGCALAAPAAFVVAAPARGGSSTNQRWVPTVRLDALEDGVPKKVQVVSERNDAWTKEDHVELGSAWLVRHGATVTAFSSVCPHLGCAVNAEAGGTGPVTFSCPCHTSAFAADGAAVSGPSPRGLDTLTTRIDGGVVVVDFRRFKVGTPDRIALA